MRRKLGRLGVITIAALIVAGVVLVAGTVLPSYIASKDNAVDQSTAKADFIDPADIPKYVNQLSGPPPVYVPEVVVDPETGEVSENYTITASEFYQQILPGPYPKTEVFGYGGQAKDPVTGTNLGYVKNSPGPTIEATRGVAANIKWVNEIKGSSMFAVDPTICWANPNMMPMDPSPPWPAYPPGFPQAQSPVPISSHVHGAEVQSTSDGNPDAWFTYSGMHGAAYNSEEPTDPNAAVYHYPNMQPAATIWYHDHALGMTRLNVMSGLAGFYLLRDAADTLAPSLPQGKYDVPIVLQDRIFLTDGSMWFPTIGTMPDVHPYWASMFYGNVEMVNGLVWPNMNVDKGGYLLRLLDGSNARFYTISFTLASTGVKLPFTQIGSDGGYLKTPVSMTELTLAPGERAMVLLDFSAMSAGTKIIMTNSHSGIDMGMGGSMGSSMNGSMNSGMAGGMGSGMGGGMGSSIGGSMDGTMCGNGCCCGGGMGGMGAMSGMDNSMGGSMTNMMPPSIPELMQFTISAASGLAKSALPDILNNDLSTFPSLSGSEKTRTLTLTWTGMSMNSGTGTSTGMGMGMMMPTAWLCDGQRYLNPVSETPRAGSTEIWRFVNPTMMAHPMHLHLVQFQVVSRQSMNCMGYFSEWIAQNGEPPLDHPTIPVAIDPYLVGSPSPAPANEQGWKDTVRCYPGQVTTVIVRFAPIDGSAEYPFNATVGPGYVWHCHIIDHEDNEMMRPYVLVNGSQPDGPNPTYQLSLSLAEGWNFVTIPSTFNPTVQLTVSMLPGLKAGDVVGHWDNSTQENEVFIIGISPPFWDISVIPGEGYWIWVSAPRWINVTGGTSNVASGRWSECQGQSQYPLLEDGSLLPCSSTRV